MRRFCLLLWCMLVALTVDAQRENVFTIDAQLRPRFEYDHGYETPVTSGQDPAMYVSNRTRLTLGYQRKNLEFKASVQHTGIWGQDNIFKNSGIVTVNEAWGKMCFKPGIFVQVGRMPLSYDDERILGNADWNVAGNWHDALRVGFENEMHQVHLFAAYNQNTSDMHGGYYYHVMPYKQLQGLRYHVQLLPEMPLGISAVALNVGYEDGAIIEKKEYAKTIFMQTVGMHLTFQPKDLDIAASFYYQFGNLPEDKKVAAFLASARVGYTIVDIVKIRAGYDYVSGNDGLNINQHAFTPLFGTNHNFFGSMDYFTARQPYGIQDAIGGVTAKIGGKVTLDLDYHYLQMAEKIAYIDLPKELGHEVDFRVSAQIFKDVKVEGGYSIMLPTRTTIALKDNTGDRDAWQDWAWISVNFNPRLLFTRW